jgi:hypothetical protein
MATGYVLDSRGSIPGIGKKISVPHSVHSGSVAYPSSNTMGTGALSPGVKQPGRDADHSFPSIADVKNGGAIYIYTLSRVSMTRGLIN